MICVVYLPQNTEVPSRKVQDILGHLYSVRV